MKDMKVIINTVNFYNNVIINHIHDRTIVNTEKRPKETNEDDLSGATSYVIINDNNEHPLIAELEARILQVENEKRELLDELNNNKK